MLIKKPTLNLKKRIALITGLVTLSFLIAMVQMFFNIVTAEDTTTTLFPSEDNLTITADVYLEHEVEKTPLIVMFHQAHWSRGEYRETAIRFNEMGYNCLAVDLRSGNKVHGVVNQTAKRAREAGKQTRMIDAYKDVKAALSYAKRTYPAPKIIALGSSYSAGLVLKAAGDFPHLVDGVIAFSPAEYFEKEGMPANWVQESASKITVPVFISSARKERVRWIRLFNAINTNAKFSYIPISSGQHGSRSLWSRYEDSAGYWQVIQTFLISFF